MSRPPAPMLSVPEKKTAAAELFRDRHFFGAPTFNDIRDARAAVAVANPQAQPPASRRALILRYHRLLFSARDDPCAFDETLSFTWYDAFRPHLKHAAASLRFEKAALVFNVGAAASRIAAAHSRATEEGVRAACGEFQRAAGAFRAVGEMMEEEVGTTVDMTSQASAMLERLMLAQAQECCFERALAGGKSPAVCSKVAKQAALFYEEAYAALVAPPLQNHFERSWVSQVGVNSIVDAKRNARGAPGPLYDYASRLEQDINKSLETAKDENYRIYLFRIPAATSLAPLPAASLVRSASLAEILEAKTENGTQSP
ncbi:unnamed protein product [Urochloa humidicola]